MNLPNQLTLGRLILCLVFTFFMQVNLEYAGVVALFLFILASLTDWLDGYLARRMGLITDLGKLLDPLADKILIAAVFIGFVGKDLAPAWMVVCIVAREFLITGLRGLASAKGVILPAQSWGKHKTISQMIAAIVGLILLALTDFPAFPSDWVPLLHAYLFDPLLYLALAITIFSGIAYFVVNQKLVFQSLHTDSSP
ncbi:MAG: CDP-diacylglycerol--glycerol-3-phosphate 3-phosphatidyltransferase [Candidatus Methylacidiphilales bacterium]